MAEAQAEHVSARAYVLTWMALLALTGLTFGLSYVRTGALRWPVALVIATVKGALVAFFFMHLAGSRSVNRLVLLVGVLFVALLIVLSVADVLTR